MHILFQAEEGIFLLFGKRKVQQDFIPYRAVVNTRRSNLIVRSGAEKGERITVAPKGARLTVYGEEGDWCRVSYRGVMGYVHGDYVMALDGAFVYNPEE